MPLFQLPLMPPSRWPLLWHCVASLVFGVAVAVVYWAVLSSYWRSQDQSAAKGQALQEQWSKSQQSAPLHKPQVPVLLEATRTQDVARDFGRFAEQGGVTVVSLQFDPVQAQAHEPGRTHIKATVQAPYADFKRWIGELLARYPSLELLSVNMRPGHLGNGQVESELSFALYVRH